MARPVTNVRSRFVDSDKILDFDNSGGGASLGGTRSAQIGLDSRSAEPLFSTQASSSLGQVSSSTAGHLDLNRERDAVLMAITNASTVFEIDLDNRAVLGEYRFVDTVPAKIFTSKYCYDISC